MRWLVLCAILLFAVGSPAMAVDLLGPGSPGYLTHIDTQYNNTSWAAANLMDDNASTRWLSGRRDNDLIFAFDAAKSERCFSRFTLQNYGSNRSVKQFMLLHSLDTSLSTDTGATGWTPVVAEASPSGPVNHLHWAQGGRLASVDIEYNSTSWAGAHINNGNLADFWLSSRGNNTLDFAFDTNWDGVTGDAINVSQLKLHNYGTDRSVKMFQVEVSQDGVNWQKLEVPGTAAGDPDFNFLISHEGARLDAVNIEYNSTTWAGANIHDGSNRTIWLSSRTNNNLDFSFDPDGDGTTGLAGDSDDYYTLKKIVMENYGSSRSVKQFQIWVKTAADNNWRVIPVPGSTTGQADFNFLSSHEGAGLTAINIEYNNSSWAAANIHDDSSQTIWLSGRTNNTLDFDFDVDFNGSPAEAGDQFTIKKIAMENYGTNRSVKNFQVEVKTASNTSWAKLEVPGTAAGDADFNFLSQHEGAALTSIDAQYNSTGWAAANIYDGSTQTIWLSSKQANTLEFDFDTSLDGASGDAVNFSKIRMQNYGSNRSVATFEIDVKIAGGAWQAVPAPGGGNTFNAAESSAEQEWSVLAQSNVTAFRIRTLTNYGDSYTGIRELEILGTSSGASHTFVAAVSSAEQSFTLDTADRPANVTAVRFRSISNYGDTYTGVREFKILGDSITRSHTFEAAESSAAQTFTLDLADRPVDVTAVRLQTISNYGDSYTGIRELQLLGDAIAASHTFVAAKPSTPQTFTLDAADKAINVVAARLRTLNNYGDSYIGAREFELLGDPVGPLYLFNAQQTSSQQSWDFPAVSGKLFRFHTFDNYGDSYTGAGEIGLETSDSCGLLGLWHLDEPNWGTVVDSTANGFDGTAKNGAHTDDASPAISGQNGTCRYGVFDGQDDYVSISTLPNLTGSFTIAAWIRAEELGNDQRIFADDRNNSGGFAFSLGDGGNGRLRFFSRNVSPVILDSAAVISQDTWHFVAVVHDVTAKSRKIYVDGATTPVAQDVYTGTWGSDNGDASIGGEVDGTSEGVPRWRFKGNIDELVIYQRSLSGDEIAILKDQTHPCSAGVPDDASGFNCIVSGGDDLTGRLYTRIAGQSFTFDVSALKDSNGDGTADGRETDFAANEDRTLLVELVDGSGGGVCTAYPALSPTVSQNLIFTNADQGRKVSSVFTVNSAYKQLRCRVTDTKPAIPVVGCSTDSFAVRPQQLQLQIPTLTNSGASGDPKQAAGTSFTLQATAINGYDGTPAIDNSRIQAHSGAVQTGTLGGLFSAADPASGTAEGNSFIYSEVGNFRFLAEGIVDTTFTSIDQPGDCIDDFSNTADGSGRIGCNFANTSVSAWVGRFIPDHFTLTINSSGALSNTCTAGGFSYSGQPINYAVGQTPTATITAWNGLGTPTVTQNYTGLYNHLQLSGINMPDTTEDASQLGVDGVTPVVLGWGLGSAVMNDQGDGTLQFIRSGDTFTYARGINDQVAPFTAAVELQINTIIDDDGVSAIGLPQLFQPTGVPVRFGRLALANAHGSELETLSVPLQVEYYDGSGNGFVTNAADLCTTGLTLSLTDLDASDGLLVTSGAGKETAIYADVPTAGGYSADDLSNPAWLFSQPPVAGDFNLNLQAPGAGNSGSAGVHVNAPAWLEYRWSGGAMSDPSSKATFGIFNRPSSIIYMRESY